MTNDTNEIEKIVLTRVMYINAVVSGLTVGIVFGLGVFFVTNLLILKGGEIIGPHLALLGQYFIGYQVTFLGSLIGLAYGLVFGFVIGYGVAFLYNWIATLRKGKVR